MELINLNIASLINSREAKRVVLIQAVEDENNPESPINLDMLENDIYEATYKSLIYPEIHLTDANKTEHDNS